MMAVDKAQHMQTGRTGTLFRTLVTWFSMVAVLSCVTIGTLTYYRRSQGIRAQVYKQLEALRDEKVDAIGDWVRERRGDLQIGVVRRDLVAFCEAHGAGQYPDHAAARLTLEAMRQAYRYHAVFLADAEGKIVLTTEDVVALTQPLPLRDSYLKQALSEERIIFSDVLVSKVHHRPALFILGPIYTPSTKKLVGVLGLLDNVEEDVYPKFTRSEYLGKTGELLLVNSDRLVQSPLRHRENAVARLTIEAEPAARGAAGQTGRIAVEDYRGEPAMAAYGHVRELGWGLVAKQDMSEIHAPVRVMARDVALISAGVLLLAVVAGVFIARRIARPAISIAHSAERIGSGEMDVRAAVEGPSEIRSIAESLNFMVDRLAAQHRISQATSSIYAGAGKHQVLSELLDDVLPMLMDTTRSQSAVAYVAAGEGAFDRALVRGLSPDRVPDQIHVNPPDHLLAEAAVSGAVSAVLDIPEGNELVVATQAGESQPRSLLAIPLMQRGEAIGVIGLASLSNYGPEDLEIADALCSTLGQSVEVCLSSEETEGLAGQLRERNEELVVTNRELQAKSQELEQQADELRQLADELEAQRKQVEGADRLKSEFLSNMSHELRTPLNSVLALSQLMISEGPGEDREQHGEYLAAIERNGRHLLGLINDVVDLSRIEAGRMDVAVSEFEVGDVVAAAVEAVGPLADEKGLGLHVDVGEAGKIHTDRDKVRQILINLLSNAQKFAEAGEIGIRVERSDANVAFAVWDTGIGIPEAELPHVFDEFRQADGSLSRRHGPRADHQPETGGSVGRPHYRGEHRRKGEHLCPLFADQMPGAGHRHDQQPGRTDHLRADAGRGASTHRADRAGGRGQRSGRTTDRERTGGRGLRRKAGVERPRGVGTRSRRSARWHCPRLDDARHRWVRGAGSGTWAPGDSGPASVDPNGQGADRRRSRAPNQQQRP